MKLSFKPTAAFVRTNLRGHTGIGLALAALMYIICLTGTYSVFYPNFERWEQPSVPEFESFPTEKLNDLAQRAYDAELASSGEAPEHVFINLPGHQVPRAAAYADDTEVFVDQNGEFGEPIAHEWTHFLVGLHYKLTLPTTLGLTLVGILGIGLVALTITGLLSHPDMVKNAFSLRLTKSDRIREMDLHNRIGVWAAPFILAIALTGAFIGLSQVVLFTYAEMFYDGDTEAVSASLFTPDPEPTDEAAPMADIAAAVRHLRERKPDEPIMYLTVHEPATANQQISLATTIADRLVWSEFYDYDGQGQPIQSAGWSDGDAGVQAYASTFRLHFGHFGGLPVKFAYVLLGLAMTYLCVGGMKIWLAKRRQRGEPAHRIERLWVATCWGTPAGIATSAMAYLFVGLSPLWTFWLTLGAGYALSLAWANTRALSVTLQAINVALYLLLPLMHLGLFGADALNPAAAGINALWLAIAIALGACLWTRLARRQREPHTALQPEGA